MLSIRHLWTGSKFFEVVASEAPGMTMRDVLRVFYNVMERERLITPSEGIKLVGLRSKKMLGRADHFFAEHFFEVDLERKVQGLAGCRVETIRQTNLSQVPLQEEVSLCTQGR